MSGLEKVWRAIGRLVQRSPSTERVLPALPQHPPHGVTVNAGDQLQLKGLRMSVEDLGVGNLNAPGSLLAEVPDWASDYSRGATFRLRRAAKPIRINYDGNAVNVPTGGKTITVALRQSAKDAHKTAHRLAEQAIDSMAAEWFNVTELDDPLREYSMWSREAAGTTLSVVTTTRLAVTINADAVVLDGDGVAKPQPQRERRWHASHAYLRRSQTADTVHDAYRMLFLALESVLSDIYPWQRGISEAKWFRGALQRAIEGYGLDMSRYLEKSSFNPYRRFLKEQYDARRCALFHAKLSQGPILPGDRSSHDDLVKATERLGRLYLDLSKHITGAAFAGGGLTYFAFEQMVERMDWGNFFVSDKAEFDPLRLWRAKPELTKRAHGPGVHLLTACWSKRDLPASRLLRAGVVAGDGAERLWSAVDVDTSNADSVKFVLQVEMVNPHNLREWTL